MGNKFRFVIDTNVLLVSISSRSQYHWIFESILQQKFEIAVTNDILSEYEEILSIKYSRSVAKNVVRALLLLPNVIHTKIYFKWNLISVDPDDNKFVDCSVAANASAIITHDKHFNILKDITFPAVKILNISSLKELLM